MKYFITLITLSVFFIQCSPNIEVYPTSNYDTLGIRWMAMERENVIYYFQGTGAKAASLYADMHEEAYERLDKVFHTKTPRKPRYFVWTDIEQGTRLMGVPVIRGWAFFEEAECHVRVSMNLGHELTHIMSYWADGTPRISYSKFISEGVAGAFDLENYDKVWAAKSATEGQNIKSVLEVWRNDETVSEAILYPVGAAFMEFLYNKNEPENFNRLIKNQAIDNAKQIYGEERFDILIAEFDAILSL